MLNVCVVDPDLEELFFIKDCLLDSEFSLTACHHSLFLGVADNPVDAAIISLKQDYSNGFAISRQLRAVYPSIKIILTSNLDLCHFEGTILSVGMADIVMHKPHTRTELICALRTITVTKEI